MATVAEELERADRVAANIGNLDKVEEDVAEALPNRERPEAVERIQRVRDELIDLSLPVMRISVAAAFLNLSIPTVNTWAKLGLLEEVTGSSPRRVKTRSVLEVRPHLQRLQELGQRRNLLEAVLARVADEELLRSSRLQESLQASTLGELEEVTDAQLDEIAARGREEEESSAS